MSASDTRPPREAEVIRYAYLWSHEAAAGRDEGVKDRPCAVVLSSVKADGRVVLLVVPVTSRKPDNPGEAIEIPLPTRRRLGLQEAPCWVVVTEVNRFAFPGPDLRPADNPSGPFFVQGTLPSRLFLEVRDAVTRHARERRLRTVSRND